MDRNRAGAAEVPLGRRIEAATPFRTFSYRRRRRQKGPFATNFYLILLKFYIPTDEGMVDVSSC